MEPFMERQAEIMLIRRSLAGDSAATAQLVRAHQGPLFAYMLRMCKRREAAEDVTQEALYKAVKNLARYDARWRFSTWLFTIARRLWMNWSERKSPKIDSELIEALPSVKPVWGLSGWTAEQRDETQNVKAVIEQAMQSLPDAQREAIVLCHQLGWPVKLAGELMNMPEGTVKSHLFRARATLREQLSAWFAREHRGVDENNVVSASKGLLSDISVTSDQTDGVVVVPRSAASVGGSGASLPIVGKSTQDVGGEKGAFVAARATNRHRREDVS
jgi:RNA polymerase sigma-70 factor, ECF subfamily